VLNLFLRRWQVSMGVMAKPMSPVSFDPSPTENQMQNCQGYPSMAHLTMKGKAVQPHRVHD
jgi:hypothetical protein